MAITQPRSVVPFDEISFVVQGPIDQTPQRGSDIPTTLASLQNIRKWFRGAEIVLSTWEGADVAGLPFDVLVKSADPGAYTYINPGPWKMHYNNGNRQIVSTRNGLKQATRKYAVKLRSDIVPTGNQWLSYWNCYPQRSADWRIFKERIVTANLFTRNPLRDVRKPFHPSDWYMFGLKEDLLLLWDIELEPEPQNSHWFTSNPRPKQASDLRDTRRYNAEQYLWKTLLSKFGPVDFDHFVDATPENVSLTQLTFANNLIILDTDQYQFYFQKYADAGRTWRYSCISHREWERLYTYYCCGAKFQATYRRFTDLTHAYEHCYLAMPHFVRATAKRISTLGREAPEPNQNG